MSISCSLPHSVFCNLSWQIHLYPKFWPKSVAGNMYFIDNNFLGPSYKEFYVIASNILSRNVIFYLDNTAFLNLVTQAMIQSYPKFFVTYVTMEMCNGCAELCRKHQVQVKHVSYTLISTSKRSHIILISFRQMCVTATGYWLITKAILEV